VIYVAFIALLIAIVDNCYCESLIDNNLSFIYVTSINFKCFFFLSITQLNLVLVEVEP